MKMWKHYVGIFNVMLLLFISCGDNNNLDGKWETNYYNENGEFIFNQIMEFSGDNFIQTDTRDNGIKKIVNTISGTYKINEGKMELMPSEIEETLSFLFSRKGDNFTLDYAIYDGPIITFSRVEEQKNQTTLNLKSSSAGKGLSGSWELYDGDFSKLYQSYGYPFEEITFSGKNYTTDSNSYFNKGTYSISGNQIEIKDADGDIHVLSFSRTENTIDIDGASFKRK